MIYPLSLARVKMGLDTFPEWKYFSTPHVLGAIKSLNGSKALYTGFTPSIATFMIWYCGANLIL